MEIFYRDAGLKLERNWGQLIADLNQTKTYNPYCQSEDFYAVFKHLILSLCLGEEIILLDADFSADEIKKLTGFSDFEKFTKAIPKEKHLQINSKHDLLNCIHANAAKWKICLFTSGTTGLPKKLTHTFANITRFVKTTTSANTWGFAYPPTHMAGLQVFFQALLNGNPVIRLFGLSREEILKEIQNYGITHISATPTFYRLLLPIVGTYPSVKRITSGGEKFDTATIMKLLLAFPNAKITNVYASTEAGSLLAAEGDEFTIKPEMQPWIQVRDLEIYVHHSLMGDSEMNKQEWYASGDLVEILHTNPLRFRFVSRKNEMINVGGYKVNPNETEEVIRSLPGIMDVRVFAKPNAVLGNILCCEVVKTKEEIDEAGIRKILQGKLQEFKIPRIIVFVESITYTSSGKMKRS
ncbi:MAG: class I adenylate-forming enzyme family protein [Bacteroidales bacterium]